MPVASAWEEALAPSKLSGSGSGQCSCSDAKPGEDSTPRGLAGSLGMLQRGAQPPCRLPSLPVADGTDSFLRVRRDGDSWSGRYPGRGLCWQRCPAVLTKMHFPPALDEPQREESFARHSGFRRVEKPHKINM